MIHFEPHRHRAEYDPDGNIILPTEFTEVEKPAARERENVRVAISQRLTSLRLVTHTALSEGTAQYLSSFDSGRLFVEESRLEGARIWQRIMDFLKQPVVVPGRKGIPKEYKRGALFFVDIVRFGGTFAGIFGLLFLSLNYQSFWQISRARMETFFTPISIDEALSSKDKEAAETLAGMQDDAISHFPQGALISYLPDVGPPQNMMIIPKLNLNVPLITPPIDSLIREDWTQVEEDIQEALKGGVVHYPGTARPGQAGNAFFTGHSSNYPWIKSEYNSIFARIHELNIGDEYWVYYGGDKHRYIVTSKKEVKPSDITVLDQPTDKRISTLMTCTPVGTTLRRLIIQAEEVDPVTAIALDVGEQPEAPKHKFNVGALPI